INKVKEEQTAAYTELERKILEYGFILTKVPGGFVLSPAVEGKPISERQYQQLSEEHKQKLNRIRKALEKRVEQLIRQNRQREKEAREALRALDERIALFATGHLIDELKEKYDGLEQVTGYLEAFQQDVVRNLELFKEPEKATPTVMGIPLGVEPDEVAFRRYQVNLLVDNSALEGAPVVEEPNPTYPNLVGRIEHRAQLGALLTDFNMIQPGALHRANGGYLIVEALDLLRKPFAWEGLKRALKNGEIRIEEAAQELGLLSTVTLDPEPIPLDVKVVLIGNPLIYYLLYQYDEDFQELFKVKADFDTQMERTPENMALYAQFIATCCRREGLRHFTVDGVARVIEHSSRLVAHQQKLAARFLDIADLVREANFWAGERGADLVTAEDVERAIDEKVYRANRIEERLRELVADGTILVNVDGSAIGQVNGLSVVTLGDYTFGRPSRITARTYLGRGRVTNIEREVELSGPIHSKGVLILAGYLGGKYARNQPLPLSVSLVFEQSYEGVEGDSASSAELYAILSDLAGLPLRQDLAVTGSVSQKGQIQAIGGVNEKIEGFFDICRLHGLTGKQGVLIPAANVKNLMLREDVREAVARGQFHIYPIETIDQGIELLTGVPAGEPDEEGNYPEGTVNRLVQDRLNEMLEKWRSLEQRGAEDEAQSMR
ncbi:MAG TPA: ATP-dependent protease, partial [Anaerolineae bacterium]|nr:ATP-dependent protease [Anaerolineae bacterium]